ncbi:MAG: hypothetical protein Q9214_000929, partial [Letrouitia sp. 1 TL-2023]
MASCSILLLALKRERDGKHDCVKRHSFYSPALEAVGDWTDIHRLNGSFRFPSVWRGEPSPEVDAAWSRITDVGAFQISEEEMKRVDPTFADGAVRLSPKQGGGHMASLEVFHQLHCVNLVRQYTYKDYYQDKATSFEDPPDLLRIHV